MLFGELAPLAIEHLEHSAYGALGIPHRHGQHAAGHEARHLVHAGKEVLVGRGVFQEHWLAGLGHVTGDALPGGSRIS